MSESKDFMKILSSKTEYLAPYLTLIRLDEEADICAGTNEPGHGYDDDNDLGDL